MVTPEQIALFPLFSSVGPAERERFSQICADVRLAAGEYAVHEGDERALFAVLEGKIEVVKVVDGIERVLGERLPGRSSARCRSRSARRSRAASARRSPRASCGSRRTTTTRSPLPRPRSR